MKKSKRLLAFCCTLALVVLISGCDALQSVTEELAPAGAEPITTDMLEVGVIYASSVKDTYGDTYAHHSAIRDAFDFYGLNKDDQLNTVENVDMTDPAAAEESLQTLANESCNVIIITAEMDPHTLQRFAAAEENKHIVFLHCAQAPISAENANQPTTSSHIFVDPPNVGTYTINTYEAQYLAGIAAALKTQALGSTKIGFAMDFESEKNRASVNAFTLGAKSVYPQAEILLSAHNLRATDALSPTVAALLATGCKVIGQQAGGVDLSEEIAAQGGFSCGYQADHAYALPESALITVSENWAPYYIRELGKIIAGTWKVEFVYFDFAELSRSGLDVGCVAISNANEKIAALGTQAKIDAENTRLLQSDGMLFVGPLNDNNGKEILPQGETIDNISTCYIEGITVLP